MNAKELILVQDQDVVKTWRPRLHQKFQGRDSRLQNLWTSPKLFKKMSLLLLSLIVSNFWYFSDRFWLFLIPANTTNKKRVGL